MNIAVKLIIWFKTKIMKIDPRSQLEIAISNGLKVGKNVNIMGECILDPGHCWLINIGNNVTLAPRVHILAHDASTKMALGYTRISKVNIGNNVFVGANSIILPGVTIGNDVIIGAGSVVTKNIPDNSVAVGNPARVIKSYDQYLNKQKHNMGISPCYGVEYKIGNITADLKEKMISELTTDGYII